MSEDKRFYGIYQGICIDNEDPENDNRIRLQVPQVLGQAVTDWAPACLPVTDNANHPDHLPHLASEVAALLEAHATHATHSGTVTSSSNGIPNMNVVCFVLCLNAYIPLHTPAAPPIFWPRVRSGSAACEAHAARWAASSSLLTLCRVLASTLGRLVMGKLRHKVLE